MYWPYHHFYIQNQFIPKDNFWNIVIAFATLAAVLVALFNERFWAFWRRPIINAYFDRQLERCFRWAIVSEDSLMDQGVFLNVKRQYFRLRVSNNGLTPVRNLKAKIELFDVEKNTLADRFEPTALNWIPGSQTIDLAPNEDSYLDLISQVLEPVGEADYFINFSNGSTVKKRAEIKYKLRLEIVDRAPRGIAWDRYLRTWKLRVSFYAENLQKPLIKFFEFVPSSDGGIGKLEESSCWKE